MWFVADMVVADMVQTLFGITPHSITRDYIGRILYGLYNLWLYCAAYIMIISDHCTHNTLILRPTLRTFRAIGIGSIDGPQKNGGRYSVNINNFFLMFLGSQSTYIKYRIR